MSTSVPPRSHGQAAYLTSWQLRGLQQLGDAWCPGDDELPSFSKLGCAEHVDAILEHMDPSDRSGLKLLLGLCAPWPAGLIRLKMWTLDWLAARLPGPAGAGLRFLQMGLKGLVMTLYYSGRKGHAFQGRTPHEVLGYQVGVYTGDLRD